MASLRRLSNSPFWIVCFTLPDGRRTNRSTGTRDKRQAQRIAARYEDAAREARRGRFTEARARKAIADIFTLANKDTLASSTIEDFIQSWLKRKEIEAGAGTHARYAAIMDDLREFLGARAKLDIAHLTVKEITQFREALARRLTPGSVNISMKVVRSALAQARREGLVDTNEAERVSFLKTRRVFERRPFTLPELKRILSVASEEWKGMILVGLYCGLRLSGVATLRRGNVDLAQRELVVTTRKTGRRQVLPLAVPLLRHLESIPASENATEPLFPKACATRGRSQCGSMLSSQFHGILVVAGLAQARPHTNTGKGRDTRREAGGLSFHCLRHTVTSLLKNAGVSDAVARDIIGHNSPAVSASYTHIDMDAKRRAVDKLPDILK